MCLISVKIAILRPHLLKIIYWKRLSTFLVIVQGMQLGNVYIICNILHQHLPLVILVCWNDGLNLTHAQFLKFHCCACALTEGMPFWWVWCSVRTPALLPVKLYEHGFNPLQSLSYCNATPLINRRKWNWRYQPQNNDSSNSPLNC